MLKTLIKGLKYKLSNKADPIAFSFALTYRCNGTCGYCLAKKDSKELSTEQILGIIRDAKRLGVSRVSFTGGEPLLRQDIGEIVDYSKKLGLYVNLSTNGIILKEKIAGVSKADSFTFSLDGPKDVHDQLRSNFDEVMQGIETAKSYGAKINIVTVLSRNCNKDVIDYLMRIAKSFNATVSFQPAIDVKFDLEKYRRALSYIIGLKKRGYPIFNSISGLRHMMYFPKPKRIACTAGKLWFRIEPNGDLIQCYRRPGIAVNVLGIGLENALKELKQSDCYYCWCANNVEMNKAVEFQVGIKDILDKLR